jgi:hypothetical protein
MAAMRNTLIWLLLLSPPAAMDAQTAKPDRSYDGSYYAFFTTGACQHGYALYGGGGGAEALVWKGLTIGGEASYQTFSDGWGFALGTLQLGYHLRGKNRSAKVDPFVTYGLGFAGCRCGFGGSGNFGGGATYWFKDRIGLRLEGRLGGFAREALGTFRVGISFR